MKKPLMLTRYEVGTLIKAVAVWAEGPREAAEKSACTRLYSELVALAAEMDAAWKKPRTRL